MALCRFKGNHKITEKMGIELAEVPFYLRERNDVGRSVTVKVGLIEFCDLWVVHQQNAYFPLLIAQAF